MKSGERLIALRHADLDEVVAIENVVFPYPWTKGNFADSLNSAYAMFGLRESEQAGLIAYYVVMSVLDELHLLNIAVRGDRQGQGYGHWLLDQLCDYAREQAHTSVLLEVRISNSAAIKLYSRYGFTEIGRRKAYYPAANNTREDAVVMRLPL
jgi:[ribosomal protein S18]-alanine N-acetyltransferase